MILFYHVFILTFMLAITGTQSSHILNRIVGRIIGGDPTTIGDIPYQCSLWAIKTNITFCGGVLLSEEWVLTAAHCVGKMGKYKIRYNSTISNNGGTLVEVIADYKHPYFNEAYSFDYDVALVRVEKFNSNGLQFARWPQCNEKKCVDEVDNIIQVSGWGINNIKNDTAKSILQKVRVPIVNLKQCKELYKKLTDITPRMFCAGYIKEGGKDSCQGDSGGPATCLGRLVGVVSAGTEQCALSGIPSMYTDLLDENIQKWIQDTTGIIRNCPKPGEEEQVQTETPIITEEITTTTETPIIIEETTTTTETPTIIEDTTTTVNINNNIVIGSGEPIRSENRRPNHYHHRRHMRYSPRHRNEK